MARMTSSTPILARAFSLKDSYFDLMFDHGFVDEGDDGFGDGDGEGTHAGAVASDKD